VISAGDRTCPIYGDRGGTLRSREPLPPRQILAARCVLGRSDNGDETLPSPSAVALSGSPEDQGTLNGRRQFDSLRTHPAVELRERFTEAFPDHPAMDLDANNSSRLGHDYELVVAALEVWQELDGPNSPHARDPRSSRRCRVIGAVARC